MTIEKTATRITAIDGLRGIAAMLVMGFHLTTRYDTAFGHEAPLPLSVPWGFLGVRLFFAISGFVILMTLRNVKAPMDFVVARFSRLYPTYWAAMLLTALILFVFPLPRHELTIGQVAGNLLMFHGLFGIESVNGTYWSLEVELIFYVLMLLLWTVGALQRPFIVLALWLLASAISKLLPVPWVVTHLGLLGWIPWFALGVTVYVAVGKYEDHAWWPAIAALALLSIGLSEGLARTLWAVFVLLVMFVAATGSLRILSSKTLLFLGAISYPLYLLHEYLSYTFMLRVERAGWSPMLAVLIAAAGSVLLAYVVHILAEEKSIKWIRARYVKQAQMPNLGRWRVGLVAVMALAAAGTRLIE